MKTVRNKVNLTLLESKLQKKLWWQEGSAPDDQIKLLVKNQLWNHVIVQIQFNLQYPIKDQLLFTETC